MQGEIVNGVPVGFLRDVRTWRMAETHRGVERVKWWTTQRIPKGGERAWTERGMLAVAAQGRCLGRGGSMTMGELEQTIQST